MRQSFVCWQHQHFRGKMHELAGYTYRKTRRQNADFGHSEQYISQGFAKCKLKFEQKRRNQIFFTVLQTAQVYCMWQTNRTMFSNKSTAPIFELNIAFLRFLLTTGIISKNSTSKTFEYKVKYKTQYKHTTLYFRIKPFKYLKVMFEIINFIVFMLARL